MNTLRNGQIIYIRARVVSAPITQWIQPGDLMVELIDAKSNPVSDIHHLIEDRRAVMTLPEAIEAVGRLRR